MWTIAAGYLEVKKDLLQSACRLHDIAGWLFLFSVVLLLYGSVIHLKWTYDDTQIVKQAIQYSPYQYFSVPEIWRELSWTNLTPLITFSFDADLFLFGLNPQMFYIHHLIVIWLCAIMFYMILQLWVPRSFAIAGAFLFLIGWPLAVVSQQLMVRHYLEGLLLSLASFWFFVSGLRREKAWMFMGSVLFYMGALAAKEIYLPLVFLLLALPEREFKTRLIRAAPLFGVLAVYAIWRFHMLDVFLGFYGSTGGKAPVINAANAVALFLKQGLIMLLGPKVSKEYIFALFFLTPIVVFMVQKVRTALFIVLACVLTFLPILPVMSESSEPRYFLLTWSMISILLAFVFNFLWNSRSAYRVIGILLMASVSIFVLLYNREVWAQQLTISKQLSAEGNFILLKATGKDLLRRQLREPIDFSGLNWLRSHYYQSKEGASGFSDDIYLCENPIVGKTIWSYSVASQDVVDITSSVVSTKEDFCKRIRADAPLQVRVAFSKVGPFFSWHFGPYEKGSYSIILDEAVEKYELPSAGEIRLSLSRDLRFRVRYDSTDGWTTYSPVLSVSVSKDSSQIIWQRDRHEPA